MKDMKSSFFTEQYYQKHKDATSHNILDGEIRLEFKDICVSNGTGEVLPLQFGEFVKDMVFNRKYDLYKTVTLTSIKIIKMSIGKSNKQHTQEDSHESNTVTTEVSTQPSEESQPSEVNQQEKP